MKAKSLIVGTDLSEASVSAIVQGAAWAKQNELSLVVAHVDTTWSLTRPDAPESVTAVQEWVASHTGHPAEVVIRSGSAHAELIHLADERDAELLVVAGSGGGPVLQALWGSTAASVTRYAKCPVLIARPSPEKGPVVVGTDFSDAVQPALRIAVRESIARGVELVLLHSMYEPASPLGLLGPVVMSPPRLSSEAMRERRSAAETTLQSLLEAHSAQGKTVVSDDAPATALKKYCEQSGASLVVVGTHGRTGLERMALGSVAESVATSAGCSVAVIRSF